VNRRQFGNLFLGGSFLATAAAFLFPIVRYILPPKQAESNQKRVAAGKVKDFSPNSGKIFKFGSTPAMLVQTAEGQFLAFSAVCTHLTCTVTYDAASGTMYCPCHNGRFDMTGQVVAGPPPAPLEVYAVEVVGEDIFVSRKG
jgi:cytochrome b6-f complex iron-sulfur subunit